MRHVAVVILAATDTNRLFAYQSGADGFAVRPIHADELLDTVRSVLARDPDERVEYRRAQLMGGATTLERSSRSRPARPPAHDGVAEACTDRRPQAATPLVRWHPGPDASGPRNAPSSIVGCRRRPESAADASGSAPGARLLRKFL